jgi:sortase A
MAIGRLITHAPGDEWGPLPPHAQRRRRGWLLRALERALLLVGLVSLGYFTYVLTESYLYQALENRELDAILASAPRLPAPDTASADADAIHVPRPRPAKGSMIGRIEIPRLGVSTIIRAGSDARTLRLAVGHIPGTAFPGEPGNIGLAGHRDTFFRRLRDIKVNDEIRIVTPGETLTFKVEQTTVVKPRDTWVLDHTPTSVLTLVTCYPFTYVGSAPNRFIVRAAQQQSRIASR